MLATVLPVSQTRRSLGFENTGFETGFQDIDDRRPAWSRGRGEPACLTLKNPSFSRQAGEALSVCPRRTRTTLDPTGGRIRIINTARAACSCTNYTDSGPW